MYYDKTVKKAVLCYNILYNNVMLLVNESRISCHQFMQFLCEQYNIARNNTQCCEE